MLKFIAAAFTVITVVVFACKPQNSAVVLETGGSRVNWKLSPSLDRNLGLNVKTSATTSDEAIEEVILKIEGNREGTILPSRLTKQAWMPLAIVGSNGPSVTLLATITRGDRCYVNAVKLSGTAQDVNCTKSEGDTSPVSFAGVRAVCARLADTTIPGQVTKYAKLPSLHESYCTCQNGETRNIYFRAYDAPQGSKQFEDSCTAKAVVADVHKAKLQELCISMEQSDDVRIDVTPTSCKCGNSTLNFDDSNFLDASDAFQKQCRDEAEKVKPEDEFQRFRLLCKSSNGRLESHDACRCGNVTLSYNSYLPEKGEITETEIKKFEDACRGAANE